MSIERMERILLAVPSGRKDDFIDWLYDEREVHLEEFKTETPSWSERFGPVKTDPMFAESRVMRLQGVLEFFGEVHKIQSDFLEGLFPVRMLATKSEIDESVSAVNPETLAEKCQMLQSSIESAISEKEKIITEIERLREFDFIKIKISDLKNLRHISIRIVNAAGTGQKMFAEDPRLGEDIFVYTLSVAGNSARYLIAYPFVKDASVSEIITDFGLQEMQLPSVDNTPAGQIEILKRDLSEAESKEKTYKDEAVALAVEWRKKVEFALSYWESERTRCLQQSYMNGSANVFAAVGYIRSVRLESFKERLGKTFPDAELIKVELPADTEPPVSVTWNNFFRPAGLLVKMFGLPSYKSIDPTVFLALTFFIFFGICFGDVLYGLMLLFLASWLKKRFRDQKGLVQFFRLFTYAGVSTVIFGFAMGSWGADLTAYFGKGNFMDNLRLKMCLLDPLAKPVIALGIAIGIGVTNQFYGIFMRFLRDFRRGDIASAMFDGIFWLGYLGTLIALSLSLVLSGPKVLNVVLASSFLLFAIGLILTQGRDAEGWGARIMNGVISLYGIMGTYGTTSFIGDVISYSRLMALGMTTSVVGMSFNIIAGMLKEIPYVGFGLFLVIVIFGHVFNFAMSIMSAFVHSARLILLEWFGRFYEGGGEAFKPFGFQSSKLDIVEN